MDTDPLGWAGVTLENKFRIESVIGQGGYGVVYRALHLSLGKPIAVKFLRPKLGVSSPEQEQFLQKVLLEARALYDLSAATTHVVRALDAGAALSPRNEWTPFIVMEWLDGRTLEQDLDERRTASMGGRNAGAALALLRPAFEALAQAHQMGIVHRDVKPANLMLCRVGGHDTLKVLDFGVAKLMAGTATSGDRTSSTKSNFTPAYGAPEQFERYSTGPQTDVYALALTFQEVMTGVRTYKGKSKPEFEAQAVDKSQRPVSIPDARLAKVLAKALAVDPGNRHRSAAEFLRDLDGVVGDVPRAATIARSHAQTEDATGPVSSGVADVVAIHGSSSPGMVASPPPPRSRGLVVAAVGITGALVVLALVLVLKSLLTTATTPANPTAPAGMVIVDQGLASVGGAPVVVKSFAIDRTEVTVREYRKCIDAGKCTSTADAAAKEEARGDHGLTLCNELVMGHENHPINCVSLQLARTYCLWRGARLPTEPEWQRAAFGEWAHPWGAGSLTCTSVVHGRFGKPHECSPSGTEEVGSARPAGPFGTQDMAGNVWEWVEGSEMVLRGGGWDTAAPAPGDARFAKAPGGVSAGFRCAQSL